MTKTQHSCTHTEWYSPNQDTLIATAVNAMVKVSDDLLPPDTERMKNYENAKLLVKLFHIPRPILNQQDSPTAMTLLLASLMRFSDGHSLVELPMLRNMAMQFGGRTETSFRSCPPLLQPKYPLHMDHHHLGTKAHKPHQRQQAENPEKLYTMNWYCWTTN